MPKKPIITWNQETSKRVETLSGVGLDAKQIANVEGMSRATIFRLYAKELSDGRDKAIANVSKKAYELAMSGKNPAMLMFWLKCRAQWREVQRIEHSGPDGKAIETKADMIVYESKWGGTQEPSDGNANKESDS
jgi:transposase